MGNPQDTRNVSPFKSGETIIFPKVESGKDYLVSLADAANTVVGVKVAKQDEEVSFQVDM